nr:NYN domain-containing protein [Nocardia bovistercoris]
MIDSDNTPPRRIGAVLAEIERRYGRAGIVRAYGDWSRPHLGGWRHPVIVYSIRPIHHFASASGKNSTDIALAIDALDLLHTTDLRAVVLVSSDSDFTTLARRIHEFGCRVYGVGNAQTSQMLVTACDEFLYLENLTAAPRSPQPGPAAVPESAPGGPRTAIDVSPEVAARLREVVAKSAADEDGWAHLSMVANMLIKHFPEFSPRSYGHARFGKFVAASALFDVREVSPGKGKSKVTYVRWVEQAHSTG